MRIHFRPWVFCAPPFEQGGLGTVAFLIPYQSLRIFHRQSILSHFFHLRARGRTVKLLFSPPLLVLDHLLSFIRSVEIFLTHTLKAIPKVTLQQAFFSVDVRLCSISSALSLQPLALGFLRAVFFTTSGSRPICNPSPSWQNGDCRLAWLSA